MLHDGNLLVQKVGYILASLCEGELFFVSIFSSEKNQLQIVKKRKKFRKIFSLIYLLKNPERKKIRHHF